MTQRTPTLWDTNTTKNDGVQYSSATVTYSGATTYYSSQTVGVDEYGKVAGAWTPIAKTPSIWIANPLNVNLYTYDKVPGTYDSFMPSYDGIFTGIDTVADKKPTQWSSL